MPDPTPAPGPTAADLAASAEAAPPAPTGDTVSVRVPWPLSRFLSGVDGVPDITTEPTPIPASALVAVQTAARAAHVELIEEQS